MAKYERNFPELKKELTEYEDRLAFLMQYTSWDLSPVGGLIPTLKSVAKELKEMAIKEWKKGWNTKTKAAYEQGKEEGAKQAKTVAANTCCCPVCAVPQKWEYCEKVYTNRPAINKYERNSIAFSFPIFNEKNINEMGMEGWEMMRIEKGEFTTSVLFKRLKIEGNGKD